MLIGVDAGCLGIKDERLKVGVYQTTKNLLIELGKIDRKNNYLLYSFYPINKKLLSEFGERMENVVVKPSRGWQKIWLPIRIVKDKPDVFLALSQAIPLKLPFSPPLRTIGFIYDIAFEGFPDLYPDSFLRMRKNTREVVKHSDCLITTSNSSKKDIVKFYEVNPQKIVVSYLGISDVFKLYGKKYQSEKPYFLFIGALKRIKNIPGAIKGFSYFIETSQLDYYLCIAGGDKWLDSGIKKALKKVPLEVRERIKFLGFVSEEELSSLYRGATAFVSPSFYEGFGLTFLEAMSLGCPVIGSNRGSIPEVVSDCGILVDPENSKEIGEAMICMAKNTELRNKYIKKGLKRSRQFTWNFLAKEVMNSYEKKT